eukprot:504383-Amphidinium_carterae.1
MPTTQVYVHLGMKSARPIRDVRDTFAELALAVTKLLDMSEHWHFRESTERTVAPGKALTSITGSSGNLDARSSNPRTWLC